MVQTITLPRVVVTRSAAQEVIRMANLVGGDDTVKVLARSVASSSQSFADELVQQLRERGFHTVILLGAPRELTSDFRASAERAGDLRVTKSADLVAS